jgi:hypothetical protein
MTLPLKGGRGMCSIEFLLPTEAKHTKDLVQFENKIYPVIGTHCEGKRVLIKLDGKQKSVGVAKLKTVFHQKTWVRAS